MNTLQQLLAFSLAALVLLTGFVPSVSALGGWVDHKFELERPDGTRMDLKGAKMHIYHHNEEDSFQHINNFCAYPDKDPNIAKYVDKDNNPDDITLSGGYHCLTPQSCSNTDYGAPYLPPSFNSTDSIYHTGNGGSSGDASYRAFHPTNFTGALTGNVAYLAGLYKQGNIRGFDGAKWQIQLDWTKGSGVAKATQSEINAIPSREGGGNWGTIPGIDGKQSWSEGEVYKDSNGENQLHARITWVLKPPAAAAPQKPTATYSGKCVSSDANGIGSYEYTINNIDLKGLPFDYSRIFLDFVGSPQTRKVQQFLGTPSYGPATPGDGQSFGYFLTIYHEQPANGYASLYNGNTRIGGTPSSKTLKDLIEYLDAQRKIDPNSVPANFTIKGNIATLNNGASLLNDSITPDFKPTFARYECGGAPPPPPPTGAPACVSITLEYADAARVGQPVDKSSVKIGDSVRAVCGPVANVEYSFKVFRPNNPTPFISAPSSNNRSTLMIIDQPGRFYVQCALCRAGQCEFEPAPF